MKRSLVAYFISGADVRFGGSDSRFVSVAPFCVSLALNSGLPVLNLRNNQFFCNGIPLVIDRTVSFEKMSMIMGGFVTYSGHNVEAPQSTIVVNGKAYWIYAGGQSDREGHSSTVQEALVIINGEVDRVYAGGRSIWGETFVHNSTVIVKGTAREVYYSGYTEYSAARATVGRANMKIYGWYYKYGLGLGDGEIFLLDPNGCF